MSVLVKCADLLIKCADLLIKRVDLSVMCYAHRVDVMAELL